MASKGWGGEGLRRGREVKGGGDIEAIVCTVELLRSRLVEIPGTDIKGGTSTYSSNALLRPLLARQGSLQGKARSKARSTARQEATSKATSKARQDSRQGKARQDPR